MFKLTTPVYRVISIKKKTAAKFYKDIQVGDEIQAELPIESQYAEYVTKITVHNKTTKSKTETSLTQLAHQLKYLELGDELSAWQKQIESAKALVETWPEWKQNILSNAFKPTVAVPRQPVINEV